VATVFNNIDRVAGDPLNAVNVAIELIWDTSVSSIARILNEDTVVRGLYSTTTDADGYWEVDLVSNDDIIPADSLYKITERLAISNDTAVYYISVPNSATPISWIGDIVLDPGDVPNWASA
jgi:hypothetical protein